MPNYNHKRRIVLRSLLATGCALCFPRLSEAQTGKVSKAQAQYRNRPKDEEKCGNCLNFVAPNSCSLVEGEISPEGWCILWTKKSG